MTTIKVSKEIRQQLNDIKFTYGYDSINATLVAILANNLVVQKKPKVEKKKVKEYVSKLTIRQAKIEYYTKKLRKENDNK
jgi:hypothetical protein